MALCIENNWFAPSLICVGVALVCSCAANLVLLRKIMNMLTIMKYSRQVQNIQVSRWTQNACKLCCRPYIRQDSKHLRHKHARHKQATVAALIWIVVGRRLRTTMWIAVLCKSTNRGYAPIPMIRLCIRLWCLPVEFYDRIGDQDHVLCYLFRLFKCYCTKLWKLLSSSAPSNAFIIRFTCVHDNALQVM